MADRLNGVAPAWGSYWDSANEVEREGWGDRYFCDGHLGEAMDRARRDRDTQLVSPYERMRSWTFATYPADDPAGPAAKAEAQRWCASRGDVNEHGNYVGYTLVIHGTVGSGKTSLASGGGGGTDG